MSIYALPALIAMLIKAFVVAIAYRGKHASTLFLSLLGFMALHNLSEFLVITSLFDGYVSDMLLRCFYLAASFSLAYLCLFASEVGNFYHNRVTQVVILAIAMGMALMIALTDTIIVGAKSLGYTVTAVEGEWYGLFLLMSLAGIIYSVVALVQGLGPRHDDDVQVRSALILCAVAPIAIIVMIVLYAMQAGYGFTGAILIPLASSLFLVIALSTERGHQFFNVRAYLPFSTENVVARKINKVVKQHLQGELGLRETKDVIERLLIEHALDAAEQNVTWAARRIGVHRTSLYSLLKKMDIEPRGKQTSK